MTCLGCTRCQDGPWKTLIDGRVVCHQCEDWRAECEARVVCDMASVVARREYLAKVEKARGSAAVEQLKTDVQRVWASRRERPAGGGA